MVRVRPDDSMLQCQLRQLAHFSTRTQLLLHSQVASCPARLLCGNSETHRLLVAASAALCTAPGSPPCDPGAAHKVAVANTRSLSSHKQGMEPSDTASAAPAFICALALISSGGTIQKGVLQCQCARRRSRSHDYSFRVQIHLIASTLE